MKAKFAALVGAASLLIGAPALRPADAQPTTLAVGTYRVSAYVSSYTQTSGNWCFTVSVDPIGSFVAHFAIYYNGAGKTAVASISVPYIPVGNNVYGPMLHRVNLPATPTTGGAWNGLATDVVEQLNPVGTLYFTDGFAATLNVLDAGSFAGTMTLSNFVPGSTPGPLQECNITFQYVAYLIGPGAGE